MADLTTAQRIMLKDAIALGGIEVHTSQWSDADVVSQKGLATFSSPRGPGRAFKRLVPTTNGIAIMMKEKE
jgi:hypothetical protein